MTATIAQALARGEPVAKIMADLDVSYTAVKETRDRVAKGRPCGPLCACYSMPCGTPAGYDRHVRRGEPGCEACRFAAADREWTLVWGRERRPVIR